MIKHNLRLTGLLAIGGALSLLLFSSTKSCNPINRTIKTAIKKSQEDYEQNPSQKPKIKNIGSSSNGAALTASIHGDGKRHIIVLGGVHGDEHSSVSLAEALDSSFHQNEVPPNLTIIIVAVMNPDGLSSNTRFNSRRVDINRNFPTDSWRPDTTLSRYYPGESPASESETKAIISLIDTYKPVLIVSIHAPLACINWDGPGEHIAQVISKVSGYKLKRDIGYDTPGSLGAYSGVKLQIPTITFELNKSESDEQTNKNVSALRAAFDYVASQDEKNSSQQNSK